MASQNIILKYSNNYVMIRDSNVVFQEPISTPVASFTWTPTNPTPGGTAAMTDTSTNTPTSWIWQSTPTAQISNTTAENPTMSFPTNGYFTVCMSASNSTGSNQVCNVITVNSSATSSYVNGDYICIYFKATGPLSTSSQLNVRIPVGETPTTGFVNYVAAFNGSTNPAGDQPVILDTINTNIVFDLPGYTGTSPNYAVIGVISVSGGNLTNGNYYWLVLGIVHPLTLYTSTQNTTYLNRMPGGYYFLENGSELDITY